MADENEKILVQISDQWGSNAFPIEWSKLPDEVFKNISSVMTVNTLSYTEDNPATYKSVVYFRIVKKFRKNIKTFEIGDVIFGV